MSALVISIERYACAKRSLIAFFRCLHVTPVHQLVEQYGGSASLLISSFISSYRTPSCVFLSLSLTTPVAVSCVQLSTGVQVSEATLDYTHDGYRGGARMSVVHVTVAITVYHSGSLHSMIMYIVIVTLSTSFSKQVIHNNSQLIILSLYLPIYGLFRVLNTLESSLTLCLLEVVLKRAVQFHHSLEAGEYRIQLNICYLSLCTLSFCI